MSIGIYKIESPSGKIYIGQSINIEKRWKYYKSPSTSDKQNKLFNSFRKYGHNNHQFEIIEECSIELLNEKEIYWGRIFDCTNPDKGLNLRELGKQGIWTEEAKLKLSIAQKGKLRHTTESKSKISKALKGTKYTAEQKQKCSDNSGVKGKPNIKGGSKKGWKRDPIQVEQMRLEKLGKPLKKDMRNIEQFDLKNNLINSFKGPTDAQNQTGIRRDSIGNVLKNKQHTAGGFKWKYKN